MDNVSNEFKTNNQRANFYVMNRMWMNNIRGDDNRLTYEMFYCINPIDIRDTLFTKDRFYTAMSSGNIRLRPEELEKLKQYTDISPRIFIGEERFYINGISDEEWKNFLNYRTVDDNFKELQNRINGSIDDQDRFDIKNQQFFNLCKFLNLRMINETPISLFYRMINITFKDIEICEKIGLEFYQSELERNLDMVCTRLKYMMYSA